LDRSSDVLEDQAEEAQEESVLSYYLKAQDALYNTV